MFPGMLTIPLIIMMIIIKICFTSVTSSKCWCLILHGSAVHASIASPQTTTYNASATVCQLSVKARNLVF